ncbi:MAG: hypothetical protein R3E01_27580 [Pirellulaceae bacterium]
MKCTRVADRAFSDIEVTWPQPRDFKRSAKVPRLSPAVWRHPRKARLAIVRDPGGTSPYSYCAQRYSYSMIAPTLERMLNPGRPTTADYEYAYRDAEYDCEPGAGP